MRCGIGRAASISVRNQRPRPPASTKLPSSVGPVCTKRLTGRPSATATDRATPAQRASCFAQASPSKGRAVVDNATACYTGLYMEMLRNSLDLTVCYRPEGHGSRDGWHTYLRSVEIPQGLRGRPAQPSRPIGRLAEAGRTHVPSGVPGMLWRAEGGLWRAIWPKLGSTPVCSTQAGC